MFKNIIIPIDLSDKPSIKAILPKALGFASLFNAKVHFVYIIPDFGIKMIADYLPKNWAKDQQEKYQTQMTELIKQQIPDNVEIVFHIGRGAIYDEIIQYANDVKADLVIIAAVRPQLRDYMLGPNASKIVRHSSVSVLVIRE